MRTYIRILVQSLALCMAAAVAKGQPTLPRIGFVHGFASGPDT